MRNVPRTDSIVRIAIRQLTLHRGARWWISSCQAGTEWSTWKWRCRRALREVAHALRRRGHTRSSTWLRSAICRSASACVADWRGAAGSASSIPRTAKVGFSQSPVMQVLALHRRPPLQRLLRRHVVRRSVQRWAAQIAEWQAHKTSHHWRRVTVAQAQQSQHHYYRQYQPQHPHVHC